MRIEEIMTREPRSCGPKDTVENACRVMWDCDCGVVPIVDADKKVIGMLTDRDVCMAAYLQGKTLREIPVSAAMSKAVCSLRQDETVEKAEQVMSSAQVRRLPVTDAGGRLVGILSINDIARTAARGGARVSEAGVAETLAAVGEPHHEGAGELLRG
jgi:CBS domain-containing protein